jgi:predicted PurR-regulated permease PerM
MSNSNSQESRMVRNMWVVVIFVIALGALWIARHVLLLLFAATLIALILTSVGNGLRRVLPLGRKMALLAVLLLLGLATAGLSLLVGPSILDQLAELAETLPAVFSDVVGKVQASPVFQRLENLLPDVQDMASEGPGVGGVFSSTFAAGSSFIFIVFTALFLAASPDLYIRVFIRLFPPALRPDIGHSVERVTGTLKSWLLGQFISMTVVGTLTGVALAVAGVPLPVVLGILAGLGEFIPFVGPVLVSIPALLFAFSEGTDKFFIVVAIILGIQLLEGNVIMPIVQRKVVELPPVITLTSMLLLGGLFGLLGLFVAAPLVAMVLILIEEWHLKRYLGTDDSLLE